MPLKPKHSCIKNSLKFKTPQDQDPEQSRTAGVDSATLQFGNLMWNVLDHAVQCDPPTPAPAQEKSRMPTGVVISVTQGKHRPEARRTRPPKCSQRGTVALTKAFTLGFSPQHKNYELPMLGDSEGASRRF